jgi:hypothetical protein
MAAERKSWSERLGERSTATHGRRIASMTLLLALGCVCTVWLVADPSDALSGPRGFGMAFGPLVILLALFFLVREFRTGDSRK